MASTAFDHLFVRHALASYSKQIALGDLVGDDRFDVDLQEGRLSFGDAGGFACGLLGSYGEGAGTWLWAWANKSMDGLAERVTAVSRRMKDIGEARDLPELSAAETEADEPFCHRLAMVTVGESGASAYYRAPYEGGAAYLVLQEPLPSPVDMHRMNRIQRVIAEAISTFDLPHREALDAYFATEGLNVEETGPSEIHVEAEDGELRIRFDGKGRITEMKGLLRAAKPRQGFFKRLFGKD